MGNFGLQSGIPWLRIKSEDNCLLCSIEKEDMIHFALYFFNDWKSFWYRLRQVVLAYSNGDALTFLSDSVAPCGATLSSKIHGFFLYVTHLLIFSKRVRGEMSFQRGKTIMA